MVHHNLSSEYFFQNTLFVICGLFIENHYEQYCILSWSSKCGQIITFNRLTQTRQAIVDSVSGVTRDRNYGKADWVGYEFSIIDTGGYIEGSEDILNTKYAIR